MALKIPFGKHKNTGRFYDAASVPSGKDCNCVCNDCGTGLVACHRTNLHWQSYFRHESKNQCTGGLESLFHNTAKQILKENNSLHIGPDLFMSYTACDIETPRHGKRPDAYISNSDTSFIVEIFFFHKIEQTTLDIFLDNGERVLEIDISSERENIFDYEKLQELVLLKAPRKLYPYSGDGEEEKQNLNNDKGWPIALILAGLLLACIWPKSRRGNQRYSDFF